MDTRTRKILDYVSKGAMIVGLVAQLVGNIVGDKRKSIEIHDAVREELAKQTTAANSGS